MPTEITIALITGIVTLAVSIINLISNKKNAKKEDLINEINKVQKDNCKNFLVTCIAKVEDGESLSTTEKERFWENFDIYTSLKGNSYIHSATQTLQKQGKL